LLFIAFIAVGLLAPLTILLQESLTGGGQLAGGPGAESTSGFVAFFGSEYYRDAIYRTVRAATISAAISLMAGYAVALALRTKGGAIRSLPAMTLLLPIICGPLVGVVGFIASFSTGWPGYDLVNFFRSLVGVEQGRVLQTETAIVVGMVHFNLPFVVLTLLPVVANLPEKMLDVSKTLGSTAFDMFRRVIWPLTRRGVASSGIIALALSLSNFVSPYFLGGGRAPVLTTVVGQAMVSFAPDIAAAAAIVLVGLGLVLILLYGWVVKGGEA
jgi:putative spermidine/putrescine transport system permease protein